MNKVLETKYPYLMNFFKTAISQNRLFHSIILHGSNNYIQYAIALEIARQLNCLEDGRQDCDCQNCRWIRENKHPAVMTISKIDNKNDASKTVVSEEQINMVLDTLFNSSDYHRTFIFCDAEVKVLKQDEMREYNEFMSTGFSPAQIGAEPKLWYPSGINNSCFSAVGANAMLKTIEEPPSNTTFIFLTQNKDDLIQTVVSRSQAFFTADTKYSQYDTDFLGKYFEKYPVFSKETAFDFAQMLFAYQTENGLEPKYVLNCIQYYLLQMAKANANNDVVRNLIFKDIEKIEKSKKMISASIKEATVYEDLAFYLAKR